MHLKSAAEELKEQILYYISAWPTTLPEKNESGNSTNMLSLLMKFISFSIDQC